MLVLLDSVAAAVSARRYVAFFVLVFYNPFVLFHFSALKCSLAREGTPVTDSLARFFCSIPPSVSPPNPKEGLVPFFLPFFTPSKHLT